MGCCSPEYRKVVKEEEERINQKGKDSLPLWAKMGIVLVTAGVIVTAFIL